MNQRIREPFLLYTHVVRVHSVVNGKPNLSKVKAEFMYDEKREAYQRIELMNEDFEALNLSMKAVYAGCLNNETGELV